MSGFREIPNERVKGGAMVVLLNGVSANGFGSMVQVSSFIPANVASNFSVMLEFLTGLPTAATIKLWGSFDGIARVELGNVSDVSLTYNGFSVAYKPYSYVQAELSGWSAGASSGVTVTCRGMG